MKSILLFALSLFFTLSIFAQESDGDKLLHFGGSLAPKLNWFLSEDKDRAEAQTEFGFALYGNVYYDINNRLQLRSGVGLHSINNSNRDYSITLDCDFDGQRADLYNSFVEYNLESLYLGIPLETKLKVAGGANHLYWKFGVELLLRISTTEEAQLHECGINTLELDENSLYEPRKNLVLLQTGFGYEWKVSTFKLFAEPMLAYSTSKTFESVGTTGSLIVNGNTLQAGLLLGIIF